MKYNDVASYHNNNDYYIDTKLISIHVLKQFHKEL